MTFDEWARKENSKHVPSDDSAQLRKLRACWQAAIASREPMEWQPIETAPKDQFILVYPPSFNDVATCGKWYDDRYSKKPIPYWKRTDETSSTRNRKNAPTHWMPLSPPPKE